MLLCCALDFALLLFTGVVNSYNNDLREHLFTFFSTVQYSTYNRLQASKVPWLKVAIMRSQKFNKGMLAIQFAPFTATSEPVEQ